MGNPNTGRKYKTFLTVEKFRLSLLFLWMINLLEKANTLYEVFRQQSKTIWNDSTLPSSFKYRTDERLRYANFTTDSNLKVIQASEPNKSDGQDGIVKRMLKICSPFIWKPL